MHIDRPFRNRRHFWRRALGLLLATTVLPVHASGVSGATEVAQAAPEDRQPPDIIVIAPPLFRDIEPEAELDEDGIESYGVSTVDELLIEIRGEFGDGEEPLILVNGEPINDHDEIGAFPVEALRRLQVLSRGTAVRLGGRSGQRVVSLTLQRRLRSATVTVAPKVSTDGDWHAERGETLLTYVRGPTRANVGLRMRQESTLLESDRSIIQPETRLPFALGGNVVGFPDTAGEIEPLLSALAGEIVTITPIPTSASPTLADLANVANQENRTDIGAFRSLLPKGRNYELNATFATRLAPWLMSNATVRLNRNVARSLRGLSSALFVLSPDNSASPFTDEVGLTLYGAKPLQSRSERDNGDGRVTLNGRFGNWRSTFNAQHSVTKSVFDTERRSGSGAILLADTINPFATDLSDLIDLRTDRSSSRSRASLAQLSFTGPTITLPAGDVAVTVEGRLASNQLRSRSSFSGPSGDRSFGRSEQSIRGAVEVPIASRAMSVLEAIGELSATAELGRAHYSDAGTLERYALGLTWEPLELLRLRGTIEHTERPASMQMLGDGIVATPDLRVFDPLTGATVDVLQFTGGNPAILPEKVKVHRISALLRPLPRFNLQFNVEYTDTDAGNFISSLPPASLPVMLAFSDRFIRDSNGVLTIVDLRPVNFESHREKRVRWGLTIRRKIGGGRLLGRQVVESSAPDGDSADDAEPQLSAPSGRASRGRPSTYVQLTANHSIVFSDKIAIRPGLNPVNLLEGGALGIAGGRVRHQLDGTAAVTSGGVGARLGVSWRGKSELDARLGDTTDTLRFAPLLTFNLRAFADVRRILPRSAWARGLRLSLNAINVTNDRQEVLDRFGNTPLQFQRGYRDSLGRTIELEVRRTF